MSDLRVTPSGWRNSIFGFSVNSTWINGWLEDNSFSKGIDEYLLAVGSPNRVFPDTRSLRYLEVRLSVEEPLFIFRYRGIRMLRSELDRLITKASRKRSLLIYEPERLKTPMSNARLDRACATGSTIAKLSWYRVVLIVADHLENLQATDALNWTMFTQCR